MSINSVSSANNFNFRYDKTKPAQKAPKQNEAQKSEGLSYEASNGLRAQVLYQCSKNNKQYLCAGLSKKEIIATLKDKDKMDRGFTGCKTRVADIITKADDSKLAVDNFNILMNATNKRGKKLNAADVADILAVVTSINNKKTSEKSADKYGFNGGLLDDNAIDSILDKVKKQRQSEILNVMAQGVTEQKIASDNLRAQQVSIFHEQMMNQHLPGFGFH